MTIKWHRNKDVFGISLVLQVVPCKCHIGHVPAGDNTEGRYIYQDQVVQADVRSLERLVPEIFITCNLSPLRLTRLFSHSHIWTSSSTVGCDSVVSLSYKSEVDMNKWWPLRVEFWPKWREIGGCTTECVDCFDEAEVREEKTPLLLELPSLLWWDHRQQQWTE